MLTDLEADALAIVDGLDGFEGAWRLGPPPFVLARGEVAYEVVIAMREDEVGIGRTLAMLLYVHGADRVLVFDPRNGAPSPLRRATPITLSPHERARAKARAEARAAMHDAVLEVVETPSRARLLPDDVLGPTPDPFPSAKVAVIHPELAPCSPQTSRCMSARRTRPAFNRVGARLRVLMVDRDALVTLPLRGMLRGRATLTRVASRWEALERLEYQPFDRIVVIDDVEGASPTEPSLFRFYRAACTIWPHLAGRFRFVVDDRTREAVTTRRADLVDMFLRRDVHEIRSALDPEPSR